ncbi:protein kinase domain containing protein [Acanthamoeba castellanii str. Neff]|uniref:Protein kinase domain containing protein n=1 Tax=Acanthamoeba castellanii (strain ATCC 30010 / Neff) TaxID=1257118 RepID=L8GQE3_ACACF|nr:protein kinase domain containing protein [Acanthamoeba castellanii str. Neff]ELR14878.1 protein kinase domain containing protein [Acanthamoeba castellanii str. Neff]
MNHQDPYCIIHVDSCKAKTKVKRKSLLAELEPGVELRRWYTLKRRRADEFVCGQLHLQILYETQIKQVSLSDFEILHLVGEGSFGKVFQVRKKDTGQVYAMKVLKKKKLVDEGEVEHTRTEKNILINNNHPFLVNLKFAFQTEKKIYFLFFHLKKERRFDEDKVRFYAAEITLALEHLHSLGIIYRDLKPENVLLESTGHIRLTDFGLSKAGLQATKGKTTTFCGTPEYLAPEVIKGTSYSYEIDWWSLGTIMYEMFTSQPPFACRNQSQMYQRILNETPYYPNYIPASAKAIMNQLLEKDPRKRLNGKGVRKHPFFQSIDWDKLAAKKIKPPIIPHVKGEEDTSNVDKEFMERPAIDSFDFSAIDGDGLTESMDERLFAEFSYVSEREIKKKKEDKDAIPPTFLESILESINEKLSDG